MVPHKVNTLIIVASDTTALMHLRNDQILYLCNATNFMHMFFTLQRRLEGYRTFRIKIRLHRATSWVCQVKKRAISDVHTKKVLHLELWIQHNSRLSWYGLKSCLLLLMLFFSFDSVAGTSSDILCGP